MSAELRGRLVRRTLVLALTVAVITLGVVAVAQAAVWRAQAAPLDRAPIGLSQLDVQMAAELDRHASLSDQVSEVSGQIAVLRGAILTADDGITGDADSAKALETKLGAAKDKLDRLTKQLKGAKRRLEALNAAATRQAALNQAAAQQATTSSTGTSSSSGASHEADDD
jgi:chromosome segregation ATPase